MIIVDDFYEDTEDIVIGLAKAKFDKRHSQIPIARSEVLSNKYLVDRINKLFSVSIEYGSVKTFYQMKEVEWELPDIYNTGWIHTDGFHSDLAIVIYLNQDYPSECGTAFYTPIVKPKRFSHRRRYNEDRQYIGEKISHEACFNKIGTIENRFNRAAIYDSQMYHQALCLYRGQREPRIVQVAFIQTDAQTKSKILEDINETG